MRYIGGMDVPHTLTPHWPMIGDGRWARRIRTDDPSGCAAALIGLPDDLGIAMNSGRVGARLGPRALRAALARFGTCYDLQRQTRIQVEVYDAGDVQPAEGTGAEALEETHGRVSEAVRALHEEGLIPICIGGGHDLTFASVRALSEHLGQPVRGLNVDPHFDVRETAGSGMPFRALIEGGHLDGSQFAVLGAGRFANSEAHADYLLSRGTTIMGVEDILGGKVSVGDGFGAVFGRAGGMGGAGFVSIDLDAIDGAYAPGVSAVNPMGLRPAHVVEVAARAGADPAVRQLDVMELSPPHDDPAWTDTDSTPGRTARLAALVVLTFVAALGERER